MATAAIFGGTAAPETLAAKVPATMASSNASDSAATGQSSSITANDFLTLLVTEMKNQDPTANNDPNQYINQLVQVNSLQQLISINEVLTKSLGGSSPSPSTTPTPHARTAGEGTNSISFEPGSGVSPSSVSRVPGNLGIPSANPSAQALAHALDGSQ